MSKIRIELPDRELPTTGKSVSFVAPCDCTVTECIQIEGQNYTVVDAIGRTVTGASGVWTTGALVTVILNCEDKKAYIQNCAKPALAIADISNLSDTISGINQTLETHATNISKAQSAATQEVSQSQPGRMTVADKKKLDGIEEGANKITVDSSLSSSSTNPVQNKVVKTQIDKCLLKSGGTMTGALTAKGIILTEGVDYGTSFPTSGNVVGKLFLLKRG